MTVQDPRPAGSGVLTLPGEPVATRWRAREWSDVARELLAHAPAAGVRPVLVAVDGRSASGKTTVARRIAEQIPGAVVIHTDDVAWWESFFAWDHLMAAGILMPLRQGGAVDYRPPAWDRRGRQGSIAVPAGTPAVLVEGVGSSRVGLRSLLDAAIWVQADSDEAYRRGIARDTRGSEHAGREAAEAFAQEWLAEERPFLAADRPWDRADLIVCGTPELVPAEQIESAGPVSVTAMLQGARPRVGDRALCAVSVDAGPENCRC